MTRVATVTRLHRAAERAEPPILGPAQLTTFDQLRGAGAPRPSFPADIGLLAREALADAVAPFAERLDALGFTAQSPLRVNKHLLATVHGCEGRFVAEQTQGFTGWTAPAARGVVAHKAIELLLHWRGEPVPGELVDEAMARLGDADRSLSDWLTSVPDGTRAELRSLATDRVTKFLECFPPLDGRWRPVTEALLRADVAGGQVVLKGKVDLTIGFPRGATPMKVLVDLKTGGPAPHHLDDLRFYALLETIRLGVPPARLVTYYLDQGVGRAETVTEGLLAAALARTVDGIEAMLDLRPGGRSARLRPEPGLPVVPVGVRVHRGC